MLNDLEAMAFAVPVLNADELAVLQHGIAQSGGNAAVIAAGTGLGEAMLHNIDGHFVPARVRGRPCGLGRADAPRDRDAATSSRASTAASAWSTSSRDPAS